MALFKSSPTKTLERDREAAVLNRDRLAAKLTDAEQAVITSKSAAQRTALDGDDTGLDTAEHAEAAALRRLGTITVAYAEAEQVLAKLENLISAALDDKTRRATAAETEALASDLEHAGESFNIAITTLAAITAKVSPFVFEARGLEAYSASSGVQVPEAITVIASLLREHGRSVMNGSAPATLPSPTSPFVPTIPAKPVTVCLFATRAISWTDGCSQMRYSQRYTDVELPAATAARALSLKACLPIDDPTRRQHKGTWPGHPDPANCFNLDAVSPADDKAPDGLPSQFQPVNRGPAYQLKIAGAAS
jgi:hypothetical protein